MSRNVMYLFFLALFLGVASVANGVEGLLGQYYEWTGSPPTEPWGTPVMERLDPTVNFNWGGNAPDPSV